MDDFGPTDADRDLWLDELRRRMLQLARRRVGDEDAEDVVQSTLRIVAERGLSAADTAVEGLPRLAWCFQVLRNAIGNHYKSQRTRRRHLDEGSELESLPTATAGSEVGARERLLILERTLEEIEERDEQCGKLLRRSADGMSPQEIAEERGLAMNALYQRLYRCRRRLRAMLRERGVLP